MDARVAVFVHTQRESSVYLVRCYGGAQVDQTTLGMRCKGPDWLCGWRGGEPVAVHLVLSAVSLQMLVHNWCDRTREGRSYEERRVKPGRETEQGQDLRRRRRGQVDDLMGAAGAYEPVSCGSEPWGGSPGLFISLPLGALALTNRQGEASLSSVIRQIHAASHSSPSGRRCQRRGRERKKEKQSVQHIVSPPSSSSSSPQLTGRESVRPYRYPAIWPAASGAAQPPLDSGRSATEHAHRTSSVQCFVAAPCLSSRVFLTGPMADRTSTPAALIIYTALIIYIRSRHPPSTILHPRPSTATIGLGPRGWIKVRPPIF